MPSGTQNTALLKALAAEIKAIRGRLGISQDELAFRANISRTFVAKIETALNQPSITALFKLADGLEIAPDELVKAVAVRLRKEERAESRAARKS